MDCHVSLKCPGQNIIAQNACSQNVKIQSYDILVLVLWPRNWTLWFVGKLIDTKYLLGIMMYQNISILLFVLIFIIYHYISHESQTMQNIYWSCVSVCPSLHSHTIAWIRM